MATTVYKYGAMRPVVNVEIVEDQMSLGHKYHNQLIEIEHWRRDERDKVMMTVGSIAESSVRVDSCTTQLDVDLSALKAVRKKNRKATAPQALKDSVKGSRDALKAARLTLREIRKKIRTDPVIQELLDGVHEAWKVKVKRARAKSGLYWGTYCIEEQAVNAAQRSPTPPHFRRWDGSGTVAVQLQSCGDKIGISVAEALGCNDRRVQIEPPTGKGGRKKRARTVARIRVGSDGAKPIWAEIPIMYHRPLPEGARIKWVHLRRVLVADRERWSLRITMTVPDAMPSRKPMAAIDLGWRLTDRGVRVAMLWNGNRMVEYAIPLALVEANKKTESLVSTRDKMFDEIKSLIVGRRDELPAHLGEAIDQIAKWHSQARLAVIAKQLKDDHGELVDMIHAWAQQDRHLWRWESFQRRRCLNYRRNIYRHWANEICSEHGIVVLEKFDLRPVIVRGITETRDQRENQHLRVIAAPSEFRNTLRATAKREGIEIIEVPAAFSTKTCFACGGQDEWDQAGQIEHTCESCGLTWDQDENAARVLHARGEALAKERGPLEEKSPTKTKWSKRQRILRRIPDDVDEEGQGHSNATM